MLLGWSGTGRRTKAPLRGQGTGLAEVSHTPRLLFCPFIPPPLPPDPGTASILDKRVRGGRKEGVVMD